MNKERLHLLASQLRIWPRQKFNFGVWVSYKWDGEPDLSAGVTACCALGLATTMPEFRALGLKLIKDQYGKGYVAREGVSPQLYGEAVSRIDTSIQSAMSMFDLTKREAEYLFTPERKPYADGLGDSPDEYASPTEVADHIEAFIAVMSG